MCQKENNFTGFIVKYKDGKEIRQKENYLDKKTNKKRATNWHEINKNRIDSLSLYWHGQRKFTIDRVAENSGSPYKKLGSNDWFFSHSGSFDLNTHKIVVVKRNIGFKVKDILYVYSVDEETGILSISQRKAN